MQLAAGNPTLEAAIRAAIDSAVKAELSVNEHVRAILLQRSKDVSSFFEADKQTRQHVDNATVPSGAGARPAKVTCPAFGTPDFDKHVNVRNMLVCLLHACAWMLCCSVL